MDLQEEKNKVIDMHAAATTLQKHSMSQEKKIIQEQLQVFQNIQPALRKLSTTFREEIHISWRDCHNGVEALQQLRRQTRISGKHFCVTSEDEYIKHIAAILTNLDGTHTARLILELDHFREVGTGTHLHETNLQTTKRIELHTQIEEKLQVEEDQLANLIDYLTKLLNRASPIART